MCVADGGVDPKIEWRTSQRMAHVDALGLRVGGLRIGQLA